MPSLAMRKGQRVKIGANEFVILQRLADDHWQLQDTSSGEWCKFAQEDLLDRFATGSLSFVQTIDSTFPLARKLEQKISRDLASFPDELVALVQRRAQYMKEIDRLQPIAITQKSLEPLIQSVSRRIGDTRPQRDIDMFHRGSRVSGTARHY